MSTFIHTRSAALALFALVAGTVVQSAPPTTNSKEADPPRPIAEEIAVLEKGRLSAQRRSLARLAVHPDPEADKVLLAQFDRYRAGELPPAIWLDFFEAAAKRNSPALKAQLAEREQALAKSKDIVSRYRECLIGGDADVGRVVFATKPEAGCIRCHSVNGEGGKIGPDLTWLRNSMDRALILESILTPNSSIAPGFASVSLTLHDSTMVSGVVSHESDEEVTLTSVVDGKKTKIKTADIAERTPLPSPMPPHFGTVLEKRSIRDLVEFIAVGD